MIIFTIIIAIIVFHFDSVVFSTIYFFLKKSALSKKPYPGSPFNTNQFPVRNVEISEETHRHPDIVIPKVFFILLFTNLLNSM